MLLKVTIGSLVLSTVAILIRSVFRVVELWQGFSGELWNDEVDFMVLDGAMIALATVCLTVFHPGISDHSISSIEDTADVCIAGLGFGGQWHAANWTFRTKKAPRSESSDIPMKTTGSETS